MNFDIALETAKWLGKQDDIVKLNKLKELSDNQRFCVTVWGHYSAGKSRLLNNLLERDVLPVQTRETTAVLTYIQFGSYEECVIVYESGVIEKYTLNILKDVFQNTDKFEKVSKIDHIEVYINNYLLKSGLILVDTPGANSIIQKHQNLAVDAIEQSGRILYVLGNSPTNVDKQFIKQITDCGIKMEFIRTKCDRFVQTEEDVEAALRKEEMEIASFVGHEIHYIPISNERDNKWYSNINEVQKLLMDVSSKISKEMEHANNLRLSIYIGKYLEELMDEKKKMESLLNGSSDEINEKILQCKSEITLLNERLSNVEEKVETKIKKERKKAQRELNELVENQTEKFVEEMANLSQNLNVQNEVKDIYEKCVSKAINKFQTTLNGHFDMIIKEETESIISNLKSGNNEIIPPTYIEVQQENSMIIDMYKSKLAQIRERISEILEQREINKENYGVALGEFDENAYTEALVMLDEELSNIPSETAFRLSENQGLQPSEIFKKIGDVVDIGLLLLPGDMVFSVIKKGVDTTKLAQTIHKAGKVGEVIKDAGKFVEKNSKIIDRVRDTAYTLNNVVGKRRYSTQEEKEYAKQLVEKAAQKGQYAFDTYKENKREGNVLDALSVSYWAEKIGRQFDSPPKMEVDVEEEQRKNQLRQQITLQQQKLSEERMKKKKELGLFQNKEQELKEFEQEEKSKQEAIEREITKQERYVIQQAKQQAFNNYRQSYKTYYEDSITSIANEMCEQYFALANQNIAIYVRGKNSQIINEVNNKKKQMENLLELKQKENKDVEERLVKCTELVDKIQMEVECK